MNELTVLKAIEKRRSVQHFKSDLLPDTLLNALVDAAAEAPSYWNLQPWRVVLVMGDAQRKKLSAVTRHQTQIQEAPVIFVFTASLQGWKSVLTQILETAQATGAWSQEMADGAKSEALAFQEKMGIRQREFAIKDAMIAAAHVALAAESFGLGSCFLNDWEEEEVKKVIGAEDRNDIVIATLLSVGYASETRKHPGRLPRKELFFVDDLKTSYQFSPKHLRSPREKAFGLVHLPRLIDKVRLATKNQLPGYNFISVGFDRLLLDLLKVDSTLFIEVVKEAASDDEIYEWLKKKAKPLSEDEKETFNRRLLAVGPSDSARLSRFRYLLDSTDPSRHDVKSFIELIDLMEGRI
ncbi:MAG: DUF5069 domain-containing protein [Verrucomicrobiae bacterium]|nr:DUF5069 domain-containing protein [Verrucomicrobiae bacterium]